MSQFLKAALQYANAGYHIFPCNQKNKAPFTKNGHLEATTDTSTIKRWWTTHPNASIGLSLEASGLMVVDFRPPCRQARRRKAL